MHTINFLSFMILNNIYTSDIDSKCPKSALNIDIDSHKQY